MEENASCFLLWPSVFVREAGNDLNAFKRENNYSLNLFTSPPFASSVPPILTKARMYCHMFLTRIVLHTSKIRYVCNNDACLLPTAVVY